MAAANKDQPDGTYTTNIRLQGYILNLRDCINSTSQQIRKQNIKAKQTLFNIAAHFGLTDLTRNKIAQDMQQLGIVSKVEVMPIKISGFKNQKDKQKEKQRNRKNKGPEDQAKLGDPKKKVKLTTINNPNEQLSQKGKGKTL